MKAYILELLFLYPALFGGNVVAQSADSLLLLLPLAKSDTARIGLYNAIALASGDSTAIDYSKKAEALVLSMLPGANGEMEKDLHNYLADAIFAKANYYANAEEYDSAIHYYQQAIKPAITGENKKQEALILNDLGVCSYYNNDIIACIDYLKSSLAIREELKDERELRNAYNNVAFIYKETGLIENSLELNFKSLALAEKSKHEGDIATSLNNIGQIYHKYLKDYGKGMEYYEKSLAIREQSGTKREIGLGWNNLGSLYADMGKYDQAIISYRKSLALRKEANHKYGIVQTLGNLAYNYLQTGEFDKAKACLAESMQANLTLQDQNLEEANYYNYAMLYDAQHKTDSALYYALKSHQINEEFGNPLDISKSAQLLSGLYEKLGNYSKSLAYYKQNKTMQDSILNDNLKKDGIKKELEYEYLKKKTESDKQHQQQLAMRSMTTGILGILFITTIIIGIILRNRYKLKQRLKEVELRNKIASDLHDDVGSTLSSIRMYSNIVRTQPNHDKTAAMLLDKISSNSKEMIENMSDIVWMIKPGNDDFKNIENRMLNFANELCVPAGINFEFSRTPETGDFKIPMEQRRDLYLIFKEAVNNAVKYAGCHTINTTISQPNRQLQMRISDDGNGFDTSAASNGNGLQNMKKRAEANGGIFQIKSAPGEGTEIIIMLPLQ